MKSMPWDKDLWQRLKDAVSPMPPFVRQRALKTIIEASEMFARERGSEVVQEEDLVKAAKTKTPALTRRRMLDALAEMGIRVEAAEETER
jgi:DNA replicative helicase MCM subunit Mcm2 (Cdc46/Mcm family)